MISKPDSGDFADMNHSSEDIPQVLKLLSRLSNYVVGVALLLYLIGIAITDFYLGSLGIVNLSLLKARYILAGFVVRSDFWTQC